MSALHQSASWSDCFSWPHRWAGPAWMLSQAAFIMETLGNEVPLLLATMIGQQPRAQQYLEPEAWGQPLGKGQWEGLQQTFIGKTHPFPTGSYVLVLVQSGTFMVGANGGNPLSKLPQLQCNAMQVYLRGKLHCVQWGYSLRFCSIVLTWPCHSLESLPVPCLGTLGSFCPWCCGWGQEEQACLALQLASEGLSLGGRTGVEVHLSPLPP